MSRTRETHRARLAKCKRHAHYGRAKCWCCSRVHRMRPTMMEVES